MDTWELPAGYPSRVQCKNRCLSAGTPGTRNSDSAAKPAPRSVAERLLCSPCEAARMRPRRLRVATSSEPAKDWSLATCAAPGAAAARAPPRPAVVLRRWPLDSSALLELTGMGCSFWLARRIYGSVSGLPCACKRLDLIYLFKAIVLNTFRGPSRRNQHFKALHPKSFLRYKKP